MSEQGHTPTPWREHQLASNDGRIMIIGADDYIVTMFNDAEIMKRDRNNAAHIVRCVNSHDALVEALKNIISAMETDEDRDPSQSWLDNVFQSVDVARAALAAAGENP